MIELHPPANSIQASVQLPASKSIANRKLMLHAYAGLPLPTLPHNSAEDIQTLHKALLLAQTDETASIDIGHAGTAMRFLCAYLAQLPGTRVLTGSERMQQRPIAELVDALEQLGADIEYLQRRGYPPLKITGKVLTGSSVNIKASTSSQFISALLLLAPFLHTGLQIELQEKIVSEDYIRMTVALLQECGIQVAAKNKQLSVAPQQLLRLPSGIEKDWSAASYFYSICALQPGAKITLPGVLAQSCQGDSVLPKLFDGLGVQTSFLLDAVELKNVPVTSKHFRYDFIKCPDLAQTLAATCVGLGITAELTGLQTLQLKESNRMDALCAELQKFGASLVHDADSLHLKAVPATLVRPGSIRTYHDHRMAMSMAPLSLRVPALRIENEEVVRKSFPDFWQALRSLGFNVNLQP